MSFTRGIPKLVRGGWTDPRFGQLSFATTVGDSDEWVAHDCAAGPAEAESVAWLDWVTHPPTPTIYNAYRVPPGEQPWLVTRIDHHHDVVQAAHQNQAPGLAGLFAQVRAFPPNMLRPDFLSTQQTSQKDWVLNSTLIGSAPIGTNWPCAARVPAGWGIACVVWSLTGVVPTDSNEVAASNVGITVVRHHADG